MRIKVNASKFEVEVLDTKGEPVLHVAAENYTFDGDLEALKAEFERLAEQ